MTMISAILFDLDGTLVDTVPLYERNYRECLRHFGVEDVSSEDFFAVFNTNAQLFDYLDYFKVSRKHEQAFRKMRDQNFVRLLSRDSQWLHHADQILADLASRFPLGLVTGARRIYVDAIDSKLGIRRHFKSVLTVDDIGIEHRKPDPYGLLKASAELQVPPCQCLYVGDLLCDVQVARAAGMMSCLITQSSYTMDPSIPPDFCIENISQLPSAVTPSSTCKT